MKTLFSGIFRLVRFLIILLCNTVGIFLLGNIIGGVHFDTFWTALVVVISLGILNALIWPLLSRFALPLTVLTLGFASLILNGLLIILVSRIIPGFYISDVTSAILFIFGVTIVNTIVSQILSIDDNETYYRNVIKKEARKGKKVNTKTPGVIFIQIDGLSYDVFSRAIQTGDIPNMASWIRDGNYRLEKWETDWSSQTGASQSGILMGSNKNIPAFRWYDKKLKKSFTVGSHASVKEIEKTLSTGKGLLAHNGASRGNLFSGDAKDTLLTLSTIGRRDENGIGHAYYAYFSNPYNLPRTFVLFFVDAFREVKSIISQERRGVWPRLKHHKLTYPFMRAFMTVIQRDILIQTIIGDIYAGRDVVYADLVGYDEVAHHTGPERHETMAVLRDVDKQIDRIYQTIKTQEKPYHLVVLSDHGQTLGATFLERNGFRLDELIQNAMHTNTDVKSDLDNTEDSNYLAATALEITKSGGIVGKSVGKINRANPKHIDTKVTNTDVVVLASGNLGLVYFTKKNTRVTLEEIEKEYPDLIPTLLQNPYVGFLLIDSKKDGGVVLGAKGKYYLKTGKVVGKNPLDGFGENTADHIRRVHGFSTVGDIMINSFYDPILNEVAAFEEKLGSHGGRGGPQSYPFILFPGNWEYPDKPIISAENIHKQMKQWMKALGQKV